MLIADDYEVVREGMQQLLAEAADLEVVALAGSGRSTLEQVMRLRPDVAVIDLNMPDAAGIDMVRQLRQEAPDTELVVFSGVRAERVIESLFELGVKSFIHKGETTENLLAAIRSAARHKTFLTRQTSDILFSRIMQRDPSAGKKPEPHLTTRERRIVRLIAEGKSNKQIATALKVSVRTAESNRALTMRKLRVTSVAELVRYAIRNGIIEG